MELLAPAGTVAAFEAALQEGADAVYIGAPGLNARALSRDFTFGEIAGMTRHAHGQGKKLYVAMNSLMKESELQLALESLHGLAAIAPDALIIQDLGLLYLVRRYFPSLKVHASTLMTINHSLAAQYFQQLGFERVVLARELSLEEIRIIHERSSVELEIFIHGAMCFSYSGMCRFSSLHGGKSSLRGQCVQPCRRRYDWLGSGKSSGRGQSSKKGGYLFSMNDLCGIDSLAAIRDTGVVSLKIEGRLKSVEYVRNVVRAYRLAIDALDSSAEQQKAALAEAHRCLDAAMGRRRSTGFFLTGREDRIIQPHLSGSSGELVGKVGKIEAGKGAGASRTLHLQVMLQADLALGDRLRLYEERSGERKSFTLRTMEAKGRRIDQAHKGQSITVMVGDVERHLMQRPSHGLLFRVDVSTRGDKQRSPVIAKINATPAPTFSPERLRRQLIDLGVESPGKAKAPVQSGVARGDGREPRAGSTVPQWWLRVASMEGARQRLPFKVSRVVLDLTPSNVERALRIRARQDGRETVVWALPPLMREADMAWYGEAIAALRRQGADSFQIGHIGQMALFGVDSQTQGLADVKIYGDYSCNVLNTPALYAYAQAGLSGVQVSVELERATVQQMQAHRKHMARQGEAATVMLGAYIYGHPPLFSARLDAPHFQGQRNFASGRGERYSLERRPEALYARSASAYSLLPHVQELSRLGLDYFVVDISHGQAKSTCAEVIALLSGKGEMPPVGAGNFDGGLF